MPRGRKSQREETGRSPGAIVRCAVYTRKSTAEGLDQDFNSLDAQREAAELYIRSQAGEGFTCLPDHYDDGGFSGGTMERPALQRLLMDIEQGKVDCVVTYKVDRLSRSLLDFAKIMEILDRQNVSFVAVTQQFSTTHSMGRLTLNILLSFAQFEREIIAERTQDKMAAARRKGKWVGGIPMLGYDIAPEGGRLLVNEQEARRVREIFKVYISTESLLTTAKELNRRGWTLKKWKTRKGCEAGGQQFNKNSVFKLLTNIIYIGKVEYRGTVYEGEHPALVDEAVWHKAQGLLRRNGRTGGSIVRNKYGALLKGLIYCVPCGSSMGHSYSVRNNRRYRYYVCLKAQKNGWDSCPSKSIPAAEAEGFVVDRIRAIGRDRELLENVIHAAGEQTRVRTAELEQKQATLDRQLRRDEQDVRKLVEQGLRNNPHAVARLADLQERIRVAGEEKTRISDELQEHRKAAVDAADVTKKLRDFEPVWQMLAPREQARMLGLLVERVGYNGDKGTMAITYHANGIGALAEEVSTRVKESPR